MSGSCGCTFSPTLVKFIVKSDSLINLSNVGHTETLCEIYFFILNMQISKTTKISITFLVVYVIFISFILISNEIELHDQATCCGLYGYYKRYFLPFPSIESSALSDWGGGPTKLLFLNILGNTIIPIIIFLIPQLIAKIKK